MSKIKIFALGGLNENGKNMYVVEVDNNIFVFDAGLKYGNDKMLGIDYIIPNMDYLIKNKKNIRGVFITHGHEDHIGSIPFLLQTVNIPVIYAPNQAASLIRKKLEERSIRYDNIVIFDEKSKFKFKDM